MDNKLHSLLNRQLDMTDGSFSSPPNKWCGFLELIDITYKEYDEDREMLERSLDISSRELLQLNQELRAILEALPDQYICMDRMGYIIDYKAGKEFNNGYLFTSNPTGKNVRDVLIKRHLTVPLLSAIGNVLSTKELVISEFVIENSTNNDIYLEARMLPLTDTHVVILIRNITNRKEAEQKIHRQAFYDELTGLPNRSLFNDRLIQAMRLADRSNTLVAVMFIDLDRFKRINDSFSHHTGDLLICEISRRLENVLRDIDCISANNNIKNSVSRRGGDEFTIMLSEVQNEKDVATVAERILTTVSRPININNFEMVITASVGIALYPQDGKDMSDLARNADVAMYRAKELGKNGYQFYNAAMEQSAVEKLLLENDLRKAFEDFQLAIYYQPQIELKNGGIVGAETLLRWNHPELGSIPPDRFIPIAEESGLIVEMSEWIIEMVCQQIREWNNNYIENYHISVNITGRHFADIKFVDYIQKIIHKFNIDPALLGIEITESSLIEYTAQSLNTMNQLRELGVCIYLDDFGTGYSSLCYLKQFPIDVLKIDKEFVKGISTDERSAALTKTIIDMAHNLNMKVIAEGVENRSQYDFLRRYNCDAIQGYYFSKPVPANMITQLFITNNQESDKGNAYL
ncbi:MAG: EAL domain-containing protein [Sedimenticola sp.]|nr:EAL domain-containing protein [Sedimenticola sp.]